MKKINSGGLLFMIGLFFASSLSFAQIDYSEGRGRYWLDLYNSKKTYGQILVGYSIGATNGHDKGFDYPYYGVEDRDAALYSMLSSEKTNGFKIQGRTLPFDKTERVHLGFLRKESVSSINTIHINQQDGFFDTENIYLIDNYKNVFHDLKKADYTFESEVGVFNDRFEIVYITEEERAALTLSVDTPNLKETDVVVVASNQDLLTIKAKDDLISKVHIYDMAGRLIVDKSIQDTQRVVIDELSHDAQIVIVRVTLQNGEVVVLKVKK